jgi:hypothetical protein
MGNENAITILKYMSTFFTEEELAELDLILQEGLEDMPQVPAVSSLIPNFIKQLATGTFKVLHRTDRISHALIEAYLQEHLDLFIDQTAASPSLTRCFDMYSKQFIHSVCKQLSLDEINSNLEEDCGYTLSEEEDDITQVMARILQEDKAILKRKLEEDNVNANVRYKVFE